jgi:zinc and cadmium transporter
MTSIVLYAFTSVAVVGLISLVGIVTLSIQDRLLKKSIFWLVSLSVGALFGDAIIHLIPQAFESIENPANVSFFILAGIISFLVLEKFLRWRHSHDHDCDEEECPPERNRIKPLGFLIITSDSIHNLIDGIIIGASYLVSIEIGIATTLAIIMHEIPQEINDYVLLIHAGFSKIKALFLNFLSALFAIVGVIISFFVGAANEAFVPLAIAFAAGGFLYIAGSDLVPELHKTSDIKRSLQQFIAIMIGIGIMFALLAFEV